MVTLDKDQVEAQRVRRRKGSWVAAGVIVLIVATGGLLGGLTGAKQSEDLSSASVQPWPFTVDSGVLRCDAGAVTFTVNGVRYGLNGTARQRGFPAVLPIWASDPSAEGLYVSLNPVITRGLALCQ